VFYWVSSFIVGVMLRVLCRFRVEGVENVPMTGPLLVVANHLHFVDPPLLGSVMPRKVIFMAKSELFPMLILGLIVRAYEAFPIRRGEKDISALRRAMKVLDAGKALGVFPEGTRSPDGTLQRGRLGAAMLARRTNALILPIAISGTRSFLQRYNIFNRPVVRVVIGKPFRPETDETGSAKAREADLTDYMMRRLAELMPPAQRGIYAELETLPNGGEAGLDQEA
jgi:1-acyl-sn-glycerol-3-phosphate acyltransferase